jgi:hypothetical protein
MEKQQEKFSKLLKKLKEQDFTDNDEMDNIIEGFDWTIPGWPGIAPSVTKACLYDLRTRCFPCDSHWNEHSCSYTTWPGIPGFPPIGIHIDDMPSTNTILDKIKDSINTTLIAPLEKTFNGVLATMKQGVLDIIDKVTAEIKDAIQQITDGFNSAIKKLTDWFENIGKKMTSIFSEMATFFNKMEKSFTQMGRGLSDIFTGLFVDGPKGLGEGLSKGFGDIGVLLNWGSRYIFSNMICAGHFIKNFNMCFIYYVFDIIKLILYLPVIIVKWIFWEVTGFDLTEYENKVWAGIFYLDDELKRASGFNMFQYAPTIKDSCYNCKRLKVLAVKNKASEINYDFTERLPPLLNAGGNKMKKGGDVFKAAFE